MKFSDIVCLPSEVAEGGYKAGGAMKKFALGLIFIAFALGLLFEVLPAIADSPTPTPSPTPTGPVYNVNTGLSYATI